MPKPKPEPKKLGRPKLSEADAKGRIVPVRFRNDELDKITKAAKKNKQTVSQWIRSTLATALEA